MKKNKRTIGIILWICVIVVLLVVSILLNGSYTRQETIQETMKDAVLHEENRVSLFGLKDVDPAFISAVTVTVVLLAVAALIRIFAIPRFKLIPGKLQAAIEMWVGFFDNMATSNSPHRHNFLGAYIFSAGTYIFVGTIFELFGFQVVTTNGVSVAMPAPLSDINAAISLGCLSYAIILSGGIAGNKLKGVGLTLKDFSLPISMSFRLFGALLSGLLVTELVYFSLSLSYVLPVLVGILFTLLHALIQTYVLTMLTSVFYGEVSEPRAPKIKKAKKAKKAKIQAAA